MDKKAFRLRFNNIERTRTHLKQALALVNRLDRSVSTPIDITNEPYGGVGILEKLGVIETWDVNDEHFAITRAK